jgi:hypothetical protein
VRENALLAIAFDHVRISAESAERAWYRHVFRCMVATESVRVCEALILGEWE